MKYLKVTGAAAALFVGGILIGCGKPEEGSTEPAATTTTTGTGEGTVESTGAKTATATIESKSGSKTTGTATFTTEADGKVKLVVMVEGVEPGAHGIHLHEKGDCSDPKAVNAGAHWNPTGEDHGMMGETAKAHSGDMGNLEVGADGKGTLEFTSDRWTIGGDPKTDVVGKAIVIHAKVDDLKTQPSGDAGDRIGCGVIGSK